MAEIQTRRLESCDTSPAILPGGGVRRRRPLQRETLGGGAAVKRAAGKEGKEESKRPVQAMAGGHQEPATPSPRNGRWPVAHGQRTFSAPAVGTFHLWMLEGLRGPPTEAKTLGGSSLRLRMARRNSERAPPPLNRDMRAVEGPTEGCFLHQGTVSWGSKGAKPPTLWRPWGVKQLAAPPLCCPPSQLRSPSSPHPTPVMPSPQKSTVLHLPYPTRGASCLPRGQWCC